MSYEYLIEKAASMINYDPETGILTWKPKDISLPYAKGWNLIFAGKECGSVQETGYRKICFKVPNSTKNKHFLSHRLAWFIVHGKMPDGQIDHINRDKLDNRISNLRDVPMSLNQRNAAKRKANTSGVTGVYKKHSSWVAYAAVNNKQKHIGSFKNIDDAERAVKKFRSENLFTDTHGT